MSADKTRYQIQSFAELLCDIGEGDTDAELTRRFNKFIGDLDAHATNHTTAKGSFSLGLTVKFDKHGNVLIDVESPKIKVPVGGLAGSTYYTDHDEDGELVLSKRNPKQREMFEDAPRGPRAVVSAMKPKETKETTP